MAEKDCPQCRFIGTFVNLGTHEEKSGLLTIETIVKECPCCGYLDFEVNEYFPCCPSCGRETNPDNMRYKGDYERYNDYWKRDFWVTQYNAHCSSCGHDWVYEFVDPEQWGG